MTDVYQGGVVMNHTVRFICLRAVWYGLAVVLMGCCMIVISANCKVTHPSSQLPSANSGWSQAVGVNLCQLALIIHLYLTR